MIEKYLAHYSNRNKYEITRNIILTYFQGLLNLGKDYSRTNDELLRHLMWEQNTHYYSHFKIT